ncbi:hypothetical protein NQ318_011179 [Aromia moschata]|uniref:Zinc transporter 1 n=1 Tax=Aromia moschata TaxID=1265417 RepID=A0AAV8YHP1_9CUCU|nr:hypothetical protein NQ318_011179 [Aromia moschata]
MHQCFTLVYVLETYDVKRYLRVNRNWNVEVERHRPSPNEFEHVPLSERVSDDVVGQAPYRGIQGLEWEQFALICNGEAPPTARSRDNDIKKIPSVSSSIGEELSNTPCHDKKETKPSPSQNNKENRLKNTFGWARIDVIVMLICCVFLASLCFSIFVEALQTLVHIDHHDEMHHPISVLCIGAAGLLLNGVCYLLIGGYTFHQGSFLYVTESGDVVLNKVVVNESVQRGEKRLFRSRTIQTTISPPKQRQGLWEMARDINGCVLVIICALIIFFTDKEIAKYVDPVISLISVTFIMILSYPYMKESCFILLQTIPDTINIDSLNAELLSHFPDIVNVHDLHVWQLTASKVVSTVHIIFQNPKVYNKIIEEVKEFFIDCGITQVTIQPEFFGKMDSLESLNSKKFAPNCLMACQGEGCKLSHCCPNYEEPSIFKTNSKEVILESQVPELKSVRILDNEVIPPRSYSVSACSLNDMKDDRTTKIKNKINSSLNDISVVKEDEVSRKIEAIAK